MFKLSRRTMLQSAGVLTAATALGRMPVMAAPKEKIAAHGKDGWHYSHCRMCMRGDCPNMYRMENGIVVELKGNPQAPNNLGTMCPRGQALIQNLYNPYRVKAPMKRTNPKKGLKEDPKWVEITWDEALATTSKVLKEVREKDPRRFIFQVGFGDMNYFCTYLFYFAAAFGTPNYLKSNGYLCAVHYAADLCQGVFPVTVADVSKAKLVMTLGRHGGFAVGEASGGARGALNAVIDDGLKYVVVDPRCSPEAAKGEWVPIKPGTDLAFLLSFAYVILYEIKRIDTEFLRWSSNAPYLIGNDGDYHRGADGKPQIYDLSDKKIKSFDDKSLKTPDIDAKNIRVSGGTATAGFVLVKENIKKYTPEWAEKICTIPAKRIRELAKDFIANASLGKTVTLKDGKGTDRVLPLRTSSVMCNRGVMNQRDGLQTDLMSKVINQLVGAVDVPGGNLGCIRGHHLSPDKDGVVEPKMEAIYRDPVWPPQHVNLYEFFPHKHTMPTFAYKVALDPHRYGLEYEIDALLTVGGNPVSSTTEPELVVKSISNIPFSANLAYHYDEVSQLADILLPSNAILEKMSVNTIEMQHDVLSKETLGIKMLTYRDPVPPVYNTRQAQDIIMEICERVGMISDFNDSVNKLGVMIGEVSVAQLDKKDYLKLDRRYTFWEILDKGVQAYFGKEHTMESLNKNGLVVLPREAPADCYNLSHFPSGGTRIPFYFARTKRSGDGLRKFFTAHKDKLYIEDGWDMESHLAAYAPVINWRENFINSIKDTDKYNLVSINWKIPLSHMKVGGIDQLPYLNEVGENFDPTYGTICLNVETAKQLEFEEGDTVTVESANGKITGKLHLTELLFPRVVGVAGALGRFVDTLGPKAHKYPYYNLLTSCKVMESDPISLGVVNARPVRIYKG